MVTNPMGSITPSGSVRLVSEFLSTCACQQERKCRNAGTMSRKLCSVQMPGAAGLTTNRRGLPNRWPHSRGNMSPDRTGGILEGATYMAATSQPSKC